MALSAAAMLLIAPTVRGRDYRPPSAASCCPGGSTSGCSYCEPNSNCYESGPSNSCGCQHSRTFSCASCQVGYFFSNGACSPCGVHEYQPSGGVPPDAWASNPSKSSWSQQGNTLPSCTKQSNCTFGEYYVDSKVALRTCHACPLGQYQDAEVHRTTSCKQCEANETSFNHTEGAAFCIGSSSTTTTTTVTTSTTTSLPLHAPCDPGNDVCDEIQGLACHEESYQCRYGTKRSTTGTPTTTTTIYNETMAGTGTATNDTGISVVEKKGKGAAGAVIAVLLILGLLFAAWWVLIKDDQLRRGDYPWLHLPPQTAHNANGGQGEAYETALPPPLPLEVNDQDGTPISGPNPPVVVVLQNKYGGDGAGNASSTDDVPQESLPNAWFVSTMSKDECNSHVRAASKYQFLVRLSTSQKGAYAICINVDGSNDVREFLIKQGQGHDGLFSAPFCTQHFSKLKYLIHHWQTTELTPKAGMTFSITNAAAHGTSKFIAPSIRLGASELSATPLAQVMGVDPKIFHVNDKMKAIRDEIMAHGTEEDIANFQGLVDETYRNPGSAADSPPNFKTLSEIMLSAEVKESGIEMHHVVAMQLYTTKTWATINEPLRQNPPQQPNPFACTTFYISQGLGMLRRFKAKTATLAVITYWRGMRDVSVSDEFMLHGGAEMACMSTTASRQVAELFADSKCPLLFKLRSRSFMSHGADISFLSVYPGEREALYPPLTYLHPVGKTEEVVGKRLMTVVEVEPIYPQS